MFDFIKKKKGEPVPSAPEMPSPELSGLNMDAPPTPANIEKPIQASTSDPVLPKQEEPSMPKMPEMPDFPTMPESSMPDMPSDSSMSDMPSMPEMPKEEEKSEMPDMSDSGIPKIDSDEPVPPETPIEQNEQPSILPVGDNIEKGPKENINAEKTALVPNEEKTEMPPLEPIKPADIDEEPPAKIEEDTKEDTKLNDFEKKLGVKPVESITPLTDNFEDTSSVSSRIINESLFVNVEVFRNVAQIVNSLGTESKVAEEAILRINDITLNKEKVYDKWQNDLEQIERELIHLDKLLFNL